MSGGYDVTADPAIWPRALMLARNMMMTGPKATPPTFRAIRKMALRIVRGRMFEGVAGGAGRRSWRSFRREKGQ